MKDNRKASFLFFLFIKRLADIFLSFLTILVLFPFFLMISFIIIFETKGSVLFKQKRVGRNRKLFTIYKFRSMRIEAPPNVPTHLLNNPDIFITKFGRFIRRFNIDEFPQLINILIGNMSIVGPRPALWNQDDLIAEREKYGANNIRPGLTGWAQIQSRDELPITKKAEFDGYYVNHMSITMDIKIVALTLLKVFKHKGLQDGKLK